MTLDQAKAAIRGGKSWGEVFPQVAGTDEADLRFWFVYEYTPSSRVPDGHPAVDRGVVCVECGSLDFLQAGSCLTCRNCGRPAGCS